MTRNKQRVIALLLALLLAGSLAAPALAAESGTVHIRTAQDLADLSRSCSVDGWSVGKTVYLDADIDLSGTEFQPIPIFCGTFYGQGHTVSGFSLTGSGDDRGFFRYVRDGAVVQDLTVCGSVSPSDRKDNIGGLVGVNSGSLLNCAFYGNVKAGTNAGGLVGCNRPTGQIINCTYSGTLLGEHYVGGIAGQNEGSVIRCRNDGDVNITEVKTTVAIQEMDLSTIRSTESVPACTDIGGIAGASSGILQSCTNNGDVGYEHVGYNVGGIAGRQSGWLDSCVNNGAVRGRKDVGGICGQMEPRLTLLFDADSLDDLWEELDTLQALMDQAISHAEGVSDDLSGRMTGLTDSADAVKDAASDLSDAMTGWADGNIETINDASARVSWVLDRLEPISDAADAALERIRDAADLADDALDAAGRTGGLSEDALADVRLALAQVKSAAQACSDALDDVRAALEKLGASLGSSQDMAAAMEDVEAALDELMDAFGLLSGAFGDLMAALGEHYGQGGSDWGGVLAALSEMRDAADQVESALAALRLALEGAGTVADGYLREALEEIAAAAENLRAGFAGMGQAGGHLQNALDHLEAIAPLGESAAALLKKAAQTLGGACGQLQDAGETFSGVMSDLADEPEISFRPVGEAVGETGDVLDDAMGGLSDAMQSLNDTLSASSDLLLSDLRAINAQFGRVIDVLRRHSDSEEAEEDEELLEDVSDQATETDEDAGRITNARNTGAVEGDVNVAGIVGSMAIEYDYDPEDDLTTSGDRSLNFRYQAAALTEGCVNSGTVTGKKDYVGGIVGRMDLGTVSRCESYAAVESTGGDYVGGIAGAAWSSIRDCWARCALSGNDCIGGVAGLGKTVTGCRALVEVDEGSACLGAVLGDAEENGTVSGNLFTHDTLGGIDGISYLGQAEPVDFETLSQGAPAAFTRFRLVFIADGKVVETYDFSYGDALTRLPDIPEKTGCSASWPEIDYGHLTFSQTLEAEYTAYSTALTALGDPPQIVAEGTFSSGSTLAVSAEEDTWADAHGASHTGTVYTVTITDPVQPVADFQIQYRLSGGSGGTVWISTPEGWVQQEAQTDGRYLVFRADGDSVTFAVQERTANPGVLILGIIIGVVAAGGLALLWKKRGKKGNPEERGTVDPKSHLP